MAYRKQYAANAVERLAAELAEIREQALQTRRAAFVLPIVDADPDADDPTNMWAFDDGRLRFRGTDGDVHEFWPRFPILSRSSNPAASTGIDYYYNRSADELRVRRADGTWARFASVNSGSSGDSNDPGGSSTKNKTKEKSPRTFRKTYPATWGRTLCPRHGVELGNQVTFGRWSATHGQRRAMIGFNDSQIRSDLNGAKIRKVEIVARTTHFFSHSGGTIKWGGHNKGSPPGGYSAVRRNVFSAHWPKSGHRRRGGKGRVTWFGDALRDDRIRGLVIDQLSNSVSFYGRVAWPSVRLRITYTTTNY